MHWAEAIRLAFEALVAHRMRALLAMLGVIIGVVAVVLLVSLGTGVKNYVLAEFDELGTNLIIVQPGRSDQKGKFGPPIGASQRKMTLADVHAIEVRSLNIAAVTGLMLGNVEAKFEESASNITLFGSNEQFAGILNIRVAEGSFFSREEDDFGRRVIVLGRKVARDLFGSISPLGRNVRLNQSEFRVVGLLSPVGDKLGFNLDEFAFIPTTAAMRLFNDDKLFGIRAKAKSKEAVDAAVNEMTDILKERRDGEEDFTIVTQGAMMESMTSILSMLTYVLGGIAAISMLVGGIGIMNIMLVSVSERTQEIGIRRALGALPRDILKQFISEAVALSAIGGLVGLLLSVGLTFAAYLFYPAFDMRAPWWILPPAIISSLVTGVVFGVFPAYRASKTDPLTALRYE